MVGAGPTVERAAEEDTRARFTSTTLVLDPATPVLTLQGDVRLSTGRYEVRAERLTLSWPSNELMVVGSARLAWCPCELAPAALRFERLTLSPAGTLELSSLVLELDGVPVLWAPWLRLEPPGRVGLLPLELAWRGADGLFAGAGVHIPVAARGTSYVQASGGAYSTGGFAVALAAASPTSASWLRWEELSGAGLWLDLRGGSAGDEAHGVAWFADAVRGRRGVLGTPELGPAARSSDRARVALGGSLHGLVYAMVGRADSRRGGALSRVDAAGPELMLGYGAPLVGWGSVELSLGAQQLYTPAQSFSLASQRAALTLARPVTVLSLLAGAELETGARLGLGGWYAGEVSGRLRLGLPLARRSGFGAAYSGRRVHWLEPFLDASVSAVATSGRPDLGYFSAVREGAVTSAVVGLGTHHGEPRRRQAARLELRAGALLSGERWYPGTSWQGGADTELVRLSSVGALTTRDRAWLSATRLELGLDDGLELEGHVEGRSSGAAPMAGLLDPDRRRQLWTPWFAARGWSSGAALHVPVGQHWRASVAADVDATHRRWLARSAQMEYHASCGCLSVSAIVRQRAGRGGIDAAISLELTP